MVNTNINTEEIVVFSPEQKPNPETLTSEVYRNSSNYGSLTIEVSGVTGALNLVVEGSIEKNVWNPIAIISAKDFDVLSSISANGLYMCGVNGLQRIRVKANSIDGNTIVKGILGV